MEGLKDISASDVKQVIVVRKDLNMRKGKIAAQAAHASNAVLLDLIMKGELWRSAHPDGWIKNGDVWGSSHPATVGWLNNSFTKICVAVNSSEELTRLYNLADGALMPCSYIVDNGKTEFNGVKTPTCIAIGPYWTNSIDEITGGLPLL